jgi:hypothetical protein
MIANKEAKREVERTNGVNGMTDKGVERQEMRLKENEGRERGKGEWEGRRLDVRVAGVNKLDGRISRKDKRGRERRRVGPQKETRAMERERETERGEKNSAASL